MWVTIALVAMVTFTIKGFGPFVFGPSEKGGGLPAPLARVVLLLAPPLLAALVVTNALADGRRLHAGADTLGVAVAGLLVWRGLTVLPAVVVAAVVTALSRLAGLS
ncbi:MAG: branched-chain amino acid transporter [Frankiales bacterium]|nr:branched-chain amino acid transporter [Frankiales bacterium]